MIIYGTKGKHIHSEETDLIQCSHCQEQRKHTISIYGRYAHIFWIPFFPIGKKGVSECNHCKMTLAPKDMNESLKFAFQNVEKNAKRPITHWLLLIIIGVLFIAPMITSIFIAVFKSITS